MADILYICDRRACADKCIFPQCYHTKDITHALTFHMTEYGVYEQSFDDTGEDFVEIGGNLYGRFE